MLNTPHAVSPLAARPAGAVAASYRPTRAALTELAAADALLLCSALHLSPEMAESLQTLADASRLVRCPVGPLGLDSPRRPEPAWWLVRRGQFSLGQRSADGLFVERQHVGPGQWLDVAGALSAPGTWLEDACCLGPAELLAVPVSALHEAGQSEPRIAQACHRVLAERVRALTAQLADLATANVPVRLARWLLRWMDETQHTQPGAELQLPERKQVIARQLGTTSETLSRTLRRLADAGMLRVRGSRLTIVDPEALQALAHPPGHGRRALPPGLPPLRGLRED